MDDSAVEVSPAFVMYIDGTNTLTINALSNESAGNYTLQLEASLSTNTEVNDTMYLFDLVVYPVEEQVISNSTTDPIQLPEDQPEAQNTSVIKVDNTTETAEEEDIVETEKQSPPFVQKFDEPIDFKLRLTPKYRVPILPNQPNFETRTYANYKILSISTLGLMTLQLNETVIVHQDYSDLTLQDFDVVYDQKSEEEQQNMSFQIVSIRSTEIKVQLTFENPKLVS